MNTRRRFLQATALALAAGAAGARAQRPGKVARVGLLLPVSSPGGHMDLFYKGMRELGYVEGQNVVFERRFADGQDSRYAELAAELVAARVDVIIAAGPSATRAARAATSTIPIVMGTLDPVEQGLITSLSRPGGNVTGWALLTSESGQKQLALLKEAIPGLERAAVIANPRMPAHREVVDKLVAGARGIGVRLTSVEITAPEALEAAFAGMVRDRIQAFFVAPEPVVLDRSAAQIAALAARHRIPGMYQWRSYAEAGGLMSYGPSLKELVPLWAPYVDRLLKGAKPADLPVDTPRKYELVLNERAAKALGFTFPAAMRLAADDVIQ